MRATRRRFVKRAIRADRAAKTGRGATVLRRLLAVAVIAALMTPIGCDQSVAPSLSPPLRSPSSSAAPTPHVPTPDATPAISPRAPLTTTDTVTLREGTIDWETYRFELTGDNEIVAGSYDGAAKVQRTFRTWVLENGYLKVTLLPEYGGRIISIVYKPTGHEQLYRNPVGVPYQIGTGVFYYNWLMVYGGIFPTFPEPEHGKTWLLPWDVEVVSNTDQEVTVAMSINDDVTHPGAPAQYSAAATGISATFSVTLRAGRAAVDTTVALTKPADGRSPLFEYWTCATLAPGSDPRDPAATAGAEIIAPMEQVAIPDYWAAVRGQEAATDTPGVYSFRTLRLFRNWPDMGIAYAYPNVSGTTYWGVINHDNEEGLFRIADNSQTPGLKLWTWGHPQSMAVDPEATSSEIRPYIELWAGLTRQFYEKTYLPADGELLISETYAPSVGLTNVTHANANFLVNLDATRSSVADVQVFGMVPEEMVDVRLTLDGAALHTGSIVLDPQVGNTFSVPLPSGATGSTLRLVIRDQAGTELFAGSAAIGASGQ
jgi:hypothetical protein